MDEKIEKKSRLFKIILMSLDALLIEKKYEEAISLLEKKKTSQNQLAIANIYLIPDFVSIPLKERRKNAKHCLTQITDKDPSNCAALYLLISIYEKEDGGKSSIENCYENILKYENTPNVWRNYIVSCENTKFIEVVDRAIRQHGSVMYWDKANILYNLKKYSECKKFVSELKEPDDACLYFRYISCEKLGESPDNDDLRGAFIDEPVHDSVIFEDVVPLKYVFSKIVS